jgi:hypothetical protein
MELKCFICKCKIDMETETALVFQCHVYCDECLQQMETEERLSPPDSGRQDFDAQNVK